jgi:hypothetical protein
MVILKASKTSNKAVGSGMIMTIRIATMPRDIPISTLAPRENCFNGIFKVSIAIFYKVPFFYPILRR